MLDNIMIFIMALPLGLLILFSVVIGIKSEIEESIDRRKANKEEYKKLADLDAREEKIKKDEEQIKKAKEEIRIEKEDIALEWAAIEKTREDFSQKWREICEEKENIKKAYADIDSQRIFISKEFENKQSAALFIFKKATLEHQNTHKIFQSICNGRLNNAFDTDLYIKDLKISAEVGSGDHYYRGVTLTECQCEDFKRTRQPCKHMLFLIYSLGVLQMYREECYRRDNWIQDIYALQGQKKELEKKIKNAKNTQKNLDKKIRVLQASSEKVSKNLETLIQIYPDAEKIFNNDFDIDNPPILIPNPPKAVNDKKKNPQGRALREKQ